MAKLKKVLTRKRQSQWMQAATNRYKGDVIKAAKHIQGRKIGGKKVAHGKARPAALKKQHGIVTGKIKDSGPAPPKFKSRFRKK